MSERFNIYFAGKLLPDQNAQTVRANLGRLFKADETTLDKLFSGKLVLLKRDCDQATADKYQQAMERAGAMPVVKAATAEQATPQRSADSSGAERKMTTAERIAAVAAGSAATGAAPVASAPSNPAEPDAYTMAAPGSPVLREDERQVAAAPQIDISALSVDALTDRLAPVAPAPPPAPDTGHLSLGAAGEAIPKVQAPPPPPAPDISGLGLTPSGTDLSDCAPEPAPEPELDLTSLTVSPAHTDLLEEKYRRTDDGAAPDTSHLSLRE